MNVESSKRQKHCPTSNQTDSNQRIAIKTIKNTFALLFATLTFAACTNSFIEPVRLSAIVDPDGIEKIERYQLTIGKAPIPLSGSYSDDLLERVK